MSILTVCAVLRCCGGRPRLTVQVTRIWDCYLFEGEVFMLRTAVGILKLYQLKLEAGSYEEIMCHVSRLPQDISEADLFNCIASVTIDAVCGARAVDTIPARVPF